MLTSVAQQEDLIYQGASAGKTTGYIAIGMGYGKIDTLNSFILNLKIGNYKNMRNGWLADATIQITEERNDKKDSLPYSYFIFQMGAGYSIIPYKKSGLTIATTITSGIGFLMRTYEQVDDTEDNSNTTLTHIYPYLEPTLTISYTIKPDISLGLSSSYRITTGIDNTKDLPFNALNGMNLQAKLIFGF